MTANLRITPDDWRDATLACSVTPATGFEVENTQNTIRSKVLRTTSTTTMTITATWANPITSSALYLFNHLLHGASFRFQMGAYDSGTLPTLCYSTTNDFYTFSNGVKDPFRSQSASWLYFPEVTASSATLTISGTPSAVAYFQLGRVIVGRYIEFARSLKFQANIGRKNGSKSDRTEGGSRRGYRGGSWRVATGDLAGLNSDELAAWMDFMNQADTSTDFGFSLFPEDGTRREELWTMNAYLSNLDVLNHDVGIFTGRIQVEEV